MASSAYCRKRLWGPGDGSIFAVASVKSVSFPFQSVKGCSSTTVDARRVNKNQKQQQGTSDRLRQRLILLPSMQGEIKHTQKHTEIRTLFGAFSGFGGENQRKSNVSLMWL